MQNESLPSDSTPQTSGARTEVRRALVGSTRIYYEVAGQGEPLVLLHGLSGSGRWWARNVEPLARYFQVYVVDLVGFGRSRGQRFVLEETADVLLQWMDQQGEERFHLVGHSMGGLVAAELASQAPQRVSGLVLVDAAAVPIQRTLVGSALRLAPALYYMPVDFLPVLLTDALRAGPLTLLRASYALHRADITADLEKIAARTLIVWGEHDWLMTLRHGEALHHALPGSEFVVVAGAGHNPMWDRADAFNELVIQFLLRKEAQQAG